MFQTILDKAKQWSGHSLTVFWGYVQIFVGSVQSVLPSVGDVITDPSVKAAVEAYTLPKWASLSLAVMGAVTIAARARSLFK